MKISNKRLLKELQSEFRADFPFLEMEFYKPGESHPVNLVLELGLRVGDIRTEGSDGVLVLNGNLDCAAVSQTMADIFGIQMNVGIRNRIYGHFNATGKSLAWLNYRAMRLAEEVLIV